MKKLNKKGFTLIELLAVLVILVVIMTIAIPSITSPVERSKDKQKNLKIELIISAAELYADRHKNSSSGYITIENLIADGLLTIDEIKDPSNESKTLCGYVSYDSTDKIYKFNENPSYCAITE